MIRHLFSKSPRHTVFAIVLFLVALGAGLTIFQTHTSKTQQYAQKPTNVERQHVFALTTPQSQAMQVNSLPTPTITVSNGVKTFSGLGIKFQFDSKTVQGDELDVLQDGNRLYMTGKAHPQKSGYYYQIFTKSPSDTLAQAISKSVLTGYNLADCPISQSDTTPTSSYPSGTSSATMYYTKDNDVFSPNSQPQKCPVEYIPVESSKHFFMDKAHPNIFIFLSAGQVPIDTGPNGKSWLDTLTFN